MSTYLQVKNLVGKGIPVITHMLVDPTLKYCDGGSAYQGTYGHYIVTNVRAGTAELGNTVVCSPAPPLTTSRTLCAVSLLCAHGRQTWVPCLPCAVFGGMKPVSWETHMACLREGLGWGGGSTKQWVGVLLS